MSHYTMLYKYGKQTRDFGGVFNKTIIPFAHAWYEIGYSQRVLME